MAETINVRNAVETLNIVVFYLLSLAWTFLKDYLLRVKYALKNSEEVLINCLYKMIYNKEE